jgi:PTH1 family peptidyl-tRNA hydrolase
MVLLIDISNILEVFMYLILGLGNPGKEYEYTRHNAGFLFLDYLSNKFNIKINKIKFKGLYGEGNINGEKIIFLKPSTYMNKSGESLIEAMNYYKINPTNIIVVYDDVSLELGKIRIREKGSAGGHNGIKSIIHLCNTEVFKRIKIGVNSPHN